MFPLHPLRQPEGKEARPPQASRPLVWWPKLGDGRRRVTQPGTPCLRGLLPLRAVPQDVGLVLMRRPAMGARGVGPHAVARHPRYRTQGSGHKAAQQRLLELLGGDAQRHAAGRAICPVA